MADYAIKHSLSQDLQFRYIWVDTLCINQNDSEERAQQVRTTGKIYQAGVVSIFLDGRDKSLDYAAYDILHVLRVPHERETRPTISKGSWLALNEFFSKAWFKRMWVIQEFVLGRNCIIWMHTRPFSLAGLYTASWILFLMDAAPLTLGQREVMFTGMRDFLLVVEVKKQFEKGWSFYVLPSLLWKFRDRIASDPRDKIYSLLGLLSDNAISQNISSATNSQTLKHLLIDYQALVENIYASLVQVVVTETGSLNIICACQHYHKFKRTWIPDWEQPWARFSLLTDKMNEHFEFNQPPKMTSIELRQPKLQSQHFLKDCQR